MNRLAGSASPYLRQHADNPVDWRPWSAEALAEARSRDLPVLVSIGYSTCHWCHVMAHESFEDPGVAAAMNAAFICIKVDREEHPEVDAIYMDAVQALNGHGGWPLNAFCDGDGRPFHAVTYLPPPHWLRLVGQLGRLWRDDRPRIAEAAAGLTGHLQRDSASPGSLDPAIWAILEGFLAESFDPADPCWTWGGRKAPKFPPSTLLDLLLAPRARRLPTGRGQSEQVLEAMQDAGLHDRVGGGFHRYSVDAVWRVPHFEKMLYDNAQLIAAYARAGRLSGRPDFSRTAVNAGDYLLRDMRVEEDGRLAGYATAEDADDPGGEGSFYAWTPAELEAALGTDAKGLAAAWDLGDGGAGPGPAGHRVPVAAHIPHPRGRGPVDQALRASWEPLLPRLRAHRERRPRPGRDDKVLTDQNGLTLEAFSALARYAPDPAERGRFAAVCAELAAALARRAGPGGLLRLPGRPALLGDYGCLAAGLLAAYDALGDPTLVDLAARLVDEAVERLRTEDGGFWLSAGRTDLLRRTREQADNAWPAGQARLILACARLHHLDGAARWRELALGALGSMAGLLRQAPAACAASLAAWRCLEDGGTLVVCGQGPTAAALLDRARAEPDPLLVVVEAERAGERRWACLEGRREVTPQALLCRAGTCRAPAHTVPELEERLARL